MSRKSVLLLLLILLSISTVFALDIKQSPVPVPIKDKTINSLYSTPRFSTAELCTVRLVEDPYWLITGWLAGQELYKAYQDPALTCTAPYPFSVEEVYMTFYVAKKTYLNVSVDVETADLTDPSCPVPGDLVSVSSEYPFELYLVNNLPTLWRVAVPLDSAAVMDGPYFCGFSISTPLIGEGQFSQDSVHLVIDSIPELCSNYNLWNDTLGFVDLADNIYYDFPGRLQLYSAGTTGGSGGYDPMPILNYVTPKPDAFVGAPLKVWVNDAVNSKIVDSMRFEYRTSTSGWMRFDASDGANHALRNGVDPSGNGPGYIAELPPVGTADDLFRLRATTYDTLFRKASVQLDVTMDPTPPRLDILYPGDMDTICLPYTFMTNTADDDIATVKFYHKLISTDYGVSVIALHQSNYGDTDLDPVDGNPVAEGEYGDYYCGPVAAAIAMKYWNDQGYPDIMRELLRTIPVDTVVERMATLMNTRANDGTYDDFMAKGINDYINAHGSDLFVESFSKPDYMMLRKIFEERELLPIMGLSGTPGLYVVLSSFAGLDDGSGQFPITVSDPLTGMIISTYMKDVDGGSQVMYAGNWLDLDIILGVGAFAHINSRTEFATASFSGGNWIYDWESTPSLSDDSLYFFTAIGTDNVNRKEISTSVFRYHCNLNRVMGDYNGDDLVNSLDVLTLINFIYNGGSAPVGGAHRADANCDFNIDLGDVIYLVKYLYEGGAEPCH